MSKKKNPLLKPVLKWVGGKRQLLDAIMPYIDKDCSTYVEPFIGGGAVLFELKPKKAIINDYNEELVNVYNTIKDNPEELLEILRVQEEKNKTIGADYFYEIRGIDRTDEFEKLNNIERAARIIYLNKTCFNGLYRVNAAGQFNTPYGKYKNPDIANETTINAMSTYLNTNKIKILQGDYKQALKGLRKGAFVYLDPPYMPISSSSAFTGYTDGGFTYAQQEELRDECIKLHKKGIRFVQSNSYCQGILDLYSDESIFKIETVKAKRSINSKGNRRGEIDEVLIYNEPEKIYNRRSIEFNIR